MKTLLIIVSFLSISYLPLQAQPVLIDSTDVIPMFPGGIDRFYLFLFENVTYPKACKKAGIMGTVEVSFVLDTLGLVRDPRISKGIGSDCGIHEEALRLINSMNDLVGNWTPAMSKGKKVPVNFSVPIVFKLE